MDDILGAEAAMQDLNQYGRGTPTSLDKGKGIAHASLLEADAAPSTDLGGIAGTAAARESRQERRSASQQPQPVEDDEATRQRQIERVLKRAQAAKVPSPSPSSLPHALLDAADPCWSYSSRATFETASSWPRSRTSEAGRTSSWT